MDGWVGQLMEGWQMMDGKMGGWMSHFLKILSKTSERKVLNKRVKKPGSILQMDSR